MRSRNKFVELLAPVLATITLAACGGSPGGASSTPSSSVPFDVNSGLLTSGTIMAATSATAAPVTFTKTTGELQGYAIDLCNEIAHRLGLKIKYVVLPFSSILAGLTSNRYDMTCTGVAASLGTPDLLITDGTIQGAATIMVRADDDRIKSVADVKGKTMGGIQGANQIPQITAYLNNQVTVQRYPGYPEMQLDLANKRIDCYAGNLPTLIYQAKQNPALKVADLKGISPTLIAEAVRKQEPELLKAFNYVTLDMSKSGQLQDMQKKWYGSVVLPSPFPQPAASPS